MNLQHFLINPFRTAKPAKNGDHRLKSKPQVKCHTRRARVELSTLDIAHKPSPPPTAPWQNQPALYTPTPLSPANQEPPRSTRARNKPAPARLGGRKPMERELFKYHFRPQFNGTPHCFPPP